MEINNDLISPGKRLISLDAFRGLTIAGMIIVNTPGSWGHVYTPLLHADWHGITPTDLVFPFFLFIVGVSIALAYTKRIAAAAPKKQMVNKIIKRSLMIFGLGLFLALFPKFDFANIRIPGVLPRIAIVFFVCALLFLNSNWKQQATIGIGLLVGYWLVMALVPVPIDEVVRQAIETGKVLSSSGMIPVEVPKVISDSFIAANYEPGINMEAWLDRQLIPGRIWQKTWDPEGLLSTLPAIATGISGMLVGTLLVSKLNLERKLVWVMVLGFLAVVIGGIWNWFFPFNKNLWSSSFVLHTSGLATLALGASIWLVDVLGFKKGTKMGLVFGANAITAYVLHGTIIHLFWIGGDASIQRRFFNGLVDLGLAPNFVSLLWALGFMLLCYIPVYIMYKRKIFLKI